MSYVLIIDDDEDFAQAAATVLGAGGHDVEISLTTAGVIKRMEGRRPDLIVLDVMFPENNNAGFDLAREIRKPASSLGTVPILMLTAVNQESPIKFGPSDIDDAWMPVTDFLEKPVDLDVLQAKVDELLHTPKAR